MSRKARHLQVLQDSKKEEYNFTTLQDKPSKIKTRFENIEDSRYDDARSRANLYAASLGIKTPPNKLSYEKGGKKRKHYTTKHKRKRHNRTKKRY